jgi:hypothetical protein
MEGKRRPVMTFTYDMINNTHLSPLVYAIVSVDNLVMYITNEV